MSYVSHLIDGDAPIGASCREFHRHARAKLGTGYDFLFERFPDKANTFMMFAEKDNRSMLITQLADAARREANEVKERYTYLPGVVDRAVRIEVTPDLVTQIWDDSDNQEIYRREDVGPMRIGGYDCYVVNALPDPGWRIVSPWQDYR